MPCDDVHRQIGDDRFQLFRSGSLVVVNLRVFAQLVAQANFLRFFQHGFQLQTCPIGIVVFGSDELPVHLRASINFHRFRIGKGVNHRATLNHAPHAIHRDRVGGVFSINGVLIHNLDAVEVVTLRQDLPQRVALVVTIHIGIGGIRHIDLMETTVGLGIQHVQLPTFALHLHRCVVQRRTLLAPLHGNHLSGLAHAQLGVVLVPVGQELPRSRMINVELLRPLMLLQVRIGDFHDRISPLGLRPHRSRGRSHTA